MPPVRWRENFRCGCCAHRLFIFESWLVTAEFEILCGVCRAWAENARTGQARPLERAVWHVVESHFLAGAAGPSSVLSAARREA